MTVTPEPNNLPPRVKIELDTNDVTRTFTVITIRRDGQVIRSVPPTGSAVSVLYDYDCPFGTSVTYEAEGSDGAGTTVFDATWANLTGWSTVSGTPAVSGGKLTSGVVERAMPSPFTRVVVHNASQLTGFIGANTGGGPGVQENIGGDGTTIFYADGVTFASVSTLAGTGDWTMTGSQIISTAGSWANPVGLLGGDTLRVGAPSPGFTLINGVSPADFSLTATAELDATDAWLIHPINPDLSVQLSRVTEGDRLDRIYVTEDSAEEVTYDEQRELFSPLGRTNQVPVTYGNRRTGDWTLALHAPRKEDRSTVRSLLSDQAPLLLRQPASSPWDLDDGWYSVGQVTDQRVLTSKTKQQRTLSLPLTPVDPPVLVQGAQWTYGDDLIRNPTYADSLAEFPTYFDRLVGPPS